MSKKPKKPEMFVGICRTRFLSARVYLVCGRRRARLTDSEGSDFWPNEYVARRVAAWWAEELGLEVREKA